MLEQLRVLEIAEGVAGPMCGLLLADLGATVTKVEPPDGDRCREWGPPTTGAAAAIFDHLNRGKRGVRLDLASETGREALEYLLAQSDAVVVEMDPPERAEAGIDWDAVVRRHPRLVVVEINGMGEAGPYADHAGSELVYQALSGFTRYVGQPGGSPCRVGFEVASAAAGMHAYQAVLAGIYHRDKQGEGQVVRISPLAALISLKTILLAANSGNTDAWNGFHLMGCRWPPDTGWQTKDGQITFDFRHGQRDEWVAFCKAVGLDHLPDHPDYQDWRSTIYIGDRRFEYGQPYKEVFARMTSQEASDLINGLGGISVKFHDYGEMLDHPQVQVLDPLVRVPAAAEGAKVQVGLPFRFVGEERPQAFRPAPGLGEHTRAALAAAGAPERLLQEVGA